MLEAFLDESGTHKGSHIVAVAGWVAHHGYWKKFLSQWGDRPFHAKDSKCDPLKYGLHDAIVDSDLNGFVAWMKPEDYGNHANPVFKSAIGNACAVCTFDCALGICKFAGKHRLGKVAFVIEDGQPNARFIQQVLDGMKERERLGIASVTLASKKDFVQLCTADFLAHSCTSEPEWFRTLVDSGLVANDYITSERMVRMSNQLLHKYKLMKYNQGLLKAERRKNKAETHSMNDVNAKDETPQ